MAFLIHSVDDGHVPAWEYRPCDDITVTVGMALAFSSGHLVKATGTTAPTHISMVNATVSTDGDLIPTIRVTHDIIFETTCAADNSASAVGSKVTLHTDGAQVTATTTSGVAEIVEIVSTASASPFGGIERVRF